MAAIDDHAAWSRWLVITLGPKRCYNTLGAFEKGEIRSEPANTVYTKLHAAFDYDFYYN